MNSKRSLVPVLLVALFAACPQNAHAYLDPVSGSMLLQLLLGGVAGLALLFKLFWHKIQAAFGIEVVAEDEVEEDADEE